MEDNSGNNIKVSVIVPVYNSDKYLEQCLDSIVNQTLKEIEIICIDDGSSDRSPEILRSFHEWDPRVRIYTQQNSGVGEARIRGVTHAKGEYLIFWDSDDYFELSALEKLYDKAKSDEADICICGEKVFFDMNGRTILYEVLPNKKMLPEDIPFNINSCPDYILNFTSITVWNKMIRRVFFLENHLGSQEKRYNDVYTTTLSLCLAEKITVLNSALVTYRRLRPLSITETMRNKYDDLIRIWIHTASELKTHNLFPEQSFANRVWEHILWYLRSIRSDWESFEEAVNRLKDGDLEKLGITLRDPGYYYNPFYEELLTHLYREDAKLFLVSYLFTVYEMLWDRTASKQKSEKKLKKITKEQSKQLESQKNSIEENKQRIEALIRKSEALNEQIEMLQKQNADLCRKNADLKKSYNNLENSRSFRIGSAIIQFPRRIKSIINKSE